MKINWTRRNKLFAGMGGLGAVILVVVLVFTFVGMPGGGKLFGSTYYEGKNYLVELSVGDGYAERHNEGGYDEFRIGVAARTYDSRDPGAISGTPPGGFLVKPPYNKSLLGEPDGDGFNIGSGDSFQWRTNIIDRLEVGAGLGLRLDIALVEEDTGAFWDIFGSLVNAASTAYGIDSSTVTDKMGQDDLVGFIDNWDIPASELRQIARSNSTMTELGPRGTRTYEKWFENGNEGKVRLQFIFKVTEIEAPVNRVN